MRDSIAREGLSQPPQPLPRALQLRCRDAPRPQHGPSHFSSTFLGGGAPSATGIATSWRCSVVLQHCRRSIKRQRVEPHPAGADGWLAPRGQRHISYLRRARRRRRRLPIGRHCHQRHTSFIHRHLGTGTRLRSAARCAGPATGLRIGGAVAVGSFIITHPSITITHPSIGPSRRSPSLPLLEPA